jgi:hypothetical protein
MQQVKNGTVTALIGAAGAGLNQLIGDRVVATVIGVVTLFTVGIRAVIAVLDLRKRLREEKCSQNSSNQPPTV